MKKNISDSLFFLLPLEQISKKIANRLKSLETKIISQNNKTTIMNKENDFLSLDFQRAEKTCV